MEYSLKKFRCLFLYTRMGYCSLSGGIIMAKERINNPKTHADFRIRQRTTNKGKKGQIMGRYHKD
ncbi:hypothetical protein Memar_1852 [Methanoculleus marisnigri JR1]|uniref:Uncharacterized protein n=1 Tax=Methanoculleus marisnigri (strain ATCC 35101 / DSM 1498 / JR1) TaxID=368407 RepID=A3CWM8_METMJ|nr:hypothetical protein Memar_1852 [Methanoculleus marisnigri JR1]